MAGLKTGSLFTCPMQTRAEILARARSLIRRFARRGMRVLPLKFYADRALIYIYRPAHLRRDLSGALAARILKERGNPVENAVRELDAIMTAEHCKPQDRMEIISGG